MSSGITTYYLHGTTLSELPETLDELRGLALFRNFTSETLLKNQKWDFLIRKGESKVAEGFVPLSRLATTKRGIATGANEYFHLSLSAVKQAGLSEDVLIHCVGKAQDVLGIEFNPTDLQSLIQNNRKAFLVVFGTNLDAAAQKYIHVAKSKELDKRYLLAARKRWYIMETQKAAPIWAAVFGRQGLRFIHNKARALTLTTFHCVYPKILERNFEEALTLCLNAPSIQAAARAQTRVYGAGLLKFEPKDLLSILVPDLSLVSRQTLLEFSNEYQKVSANLRKGIGLSDLEWATTEGLIKKAAFEACSKAQSLQELLEKRPVQSELFLLQDERKRHAVQGVFSDVRR